MTCSLCGAPLPDPRAAYLWPDAICQPCWLEMPNGMVVDGDGGFMLFVGGYLQALSAELDRIDPPHVGTLEMEVPA